MLLLMIRTIVVRTKSQRGRRCGANVIVETAHAGTGIEAPRVVIPKELVLLLVLVLVLVVLLVSPKQLRLPRGGNCGHLLLLLQVHHLLLLLLLLKMLVGVG